MREIKFRCWQVDEFDEEDNPVKWEMIPADCLAFEEYEPLIDLLQSNEHKILMQYTGIKDKNLKEIYEGDIFYSQFLEMNVAVEWEEKFGQFTANGLEFNVEVDPKSIEIIGNVYENPEMIR